MSAVNLAKQEWAKSNFQDYIVPKYINAPFTTIQNRNQLLDSSNMLQAVMGVERIPFISSNILSNEFGANGEIVRELDGKDARVRFVGAGWANLSTANGTRVETAVIGDYLEVSYYGTGINLLVTLYSASMDARLTIDNASEIGATIYPASISTILSGRSYNPNQIVPLVSGQSLGWHTVKVRCNNVAGFPTMGIEILNQSTSLTIPVGQAFVGNKKESLAVLSNSAYNAGVVGTKGARVVKYLKDGAPSQAVRECAATPSYLTNANHTNEEVVRRINFREFGVNRADDFSLMAASIISAVFTLDDGTTTLVGSQVRDGGTINGVNGLSPYAANAFFTITFVGTGLDIMSIASTTTVDTHTLTIDGVSQGNITLPTHGFPFLLKICSGLPYGTHTVKILRSTFVSSSTVFADFIIYQPKKPILPVGAVEIADYNVTANYITDTITAQNGVGSGVIRKMSTRENTYVGSWTININTPAFNSGFQMYTNVAASYVEYSFYGTGVVFNSYTEVGTVNSTILVDGVALNAGSNIGSTVSLLQPTSGLTLSAAGVLGGSAAPGYFKVSVSGLALGFHKIRVTQNTNIIMYTDSFDIITPIHINHPTLKIGSMSLFNNDLIQASALPVSGPDLSKAKAWLLFDQINSKVLSSYGISQVLKGTTGITYVYFSKPFKTSNYIGTGNANNANSRIVVIYDRKPSYATIITSTDASVFDENYFSIAFFGELQDE